MNQGKLSRRGHSLQGYLGGFFLPYASFHRLPPLSRCHDNAFVGFRIMLCDRHARVAAALFVSMAQYRRISPARLSQLRSRVSRSPSRPAFSCGNLLPTFFRRKAAGLPVDLHNPKNRNGGKNVTQRALYC